MAKYQIVIIKDKTGNSRTIHMRSGFFFCCILLLGALIAGNVYSLQSIRENIALKDYISEMDAQLDERQSQLLAMASDVISIQDSLSRIQQFNSKLSVMADITPEEVAENVGGASFEDLSMGNLPLHRQELASRKIRSYLEELSMAAKLEEVRQQEILLTMRETENVLASKPSIIPTEGFITSRFGRRKNPFGRATNEFHKGLDIAAPRGTPIVSPANGTVTKISTTGAYGKAVEVSHGNGIVTKYAHMHEIKVEKGQKLKRYDLIGTVGSTGRSTGPHLHYEVRLNGVATDPELYVYNDEGL